jgi:hypothetical protein
MLGYDLVVQDCESYAFRESPAARPNDRLLQKLVRDQSSASRVTPRRCSTCGELLAKWEEPLTGLVIKKRRFDLSVTYDGVYIASHAFRTICCVNGLTGIDFFALPDDPDFFSLQVTYVVKFDAERAGTRFSKLCPKCGRYESVVGVTPICLMPGVMVPDTGFARTDLDFGTRDGKAPAILCGVSAGRILKAAKLKGLFLKDLPAA